MQSLIIIEWDVLTKLDNCNNFYMFCFLVKAFEIYCKKGEGALAFKYHSNNQPQLFSNYTWPVN